MKATLIFGLLLIGTGDLQAMRHQSPELEVLVEGVPAPAYLHRGTTYLEAIKGKEYSIRITNPIGTRVAVALSVDGLNTIDARHTEARLGRKWVLEPYESVVISGWQTDSAQARRFFFTTEERSYGAWLGQTENLGIISAAFFRERAQCGQQPMDEPRGIPLPSPGDSSTAPKAQKQADAAGPSSLNTENRVAPAASPAEYAATGIGNRIRHEVKWIHMDLEDRPFATVDLRYEFRPVLVKLGVIPPPTTCDPLVRRQRARGFRESAYCPEP